MFGVQNQILVHRLSMFVLVGLLSNKKSCRFSPPPPYILSEFNPSGEMPEKLYSKVEMLAYLRHCRSKCYALIEEFTDEMATSRWINEYKDYSMFEMLLYNIRHVTSYGTAKSHS